MFVLKDPNQMPMPYVLLFDYSEGRFTYTSSLDDAAKFETADRALSQLLSMTYQAGVSRRSWASGLRPVRIEPVAPPTTEWQEVDG